MKWFFLALLCVPTMAEAETCDGLVSPAFAEVFAHDWIAAWNSHTIWRAFFRIMPKNDLEFHSPGIITIANESMPGMLKGDDAKVATILGESPESAKPHF